MYKMYEVKSLQFYNGQYLVKIYVPVSFNIVFNPLFSLRVSFSTVRDIWNYFAVVLL